MIKTKKCSLCNNPAFSKGFCRIHQPTGKLTFSQKKPIKKVRETTMSKNKEKSKKRSAYFMYHLERCKRSDESFKEITYPTKANICHIFDKSRHPSLEDNLDNCIYLTFEEHQDFDRLLYSHQFEKLEEKFKNSFEKACLIAKLLLPLCQETTVFTRALNDYLWKNN